MASIATAIRKNPFKHPWAIGALGEKPKTVKPPIVPEPEPVPEVTEEVTDEEKRRARRRSGRRKTIITGELEPKTVGKKTLLG